MTKTTLAEIHAPRKCRVCGCTDITACRTDDGPCYWLDESLCSACEAAQAHVVSRTRGAGGVHIATCTAPGCGWTTTGVSPHFVLDQVKDHWRAVVDGTAAPAPDAGTAPGSDPGQAVVPLDSMHRQLAALTTPGEAKELADKAEALRHYARATKDKSLYRRAAEMQLRAIRELGRFLAEIERAGPGKRSNLERLPTLDELGVTRRDAMQAHQMWTVPDSEFEERLPETVEQAIQRATRGLNYMIRAVSRPAAPASVPPLPGGRYRVILADPPWRFETYGPAGGDRAPDMHYATMTTPEICALPVAELAAEDSALLLWVYSPMLPEALKVIQFWGFDYKTIAFNWVKKGEDQTEAPMGSGYWTRHQSEICVLATRGRPQRLNADVRQVIEAPRGRHSAKPGEQYARIERLVAGPYLELFARTARDGWDCWGAEAPGGGHA